jgi:ABC-type uncharacterized transport system auxiliary subunit
VRSASHSARLALLAACGLLLCAALAGCTTTQEKAALQQAQSKRILEARAQKHEKAAKQHETGSEKR